MQSKHVMKEEGESVCMSLFVPQTDSAFANPVYWFSVSFPITN